MELLCRKEIHSVVGKGFKATMKKDSVVLLSAGLDSTVNLYAAMVETQVKLAITFEYGQRAAAAEIVQAKKIADLNKIPHMIVNLPWLKLLGSSALTHEDKAVPSGRQVSLDNKQVADVTAKAVWVPNRNGIFLNIAAAFAESIKAEIIVPGFNREEAITFPDNSLDFVRAARKSLVFSTATQVDVQCYTITMSKNEIVDLGKKLKVPFELIWPCYHGNAKWCGECESCLRTKRAFVHGRVDANTMFEK
jgi:7-cyano-7-deazaguanine synthase